MNKAVRVLVVDDSRDDALLVVDELASNGFDVTHLRVDTPEAMRSALRDHTWDMIICDYNMPGFGGLEALHLLQETAADIPFILVSGTAAENTGVEMMQAGVQDFVMKHSLFRLVPAVRRELADALVRKERRQAQADWRESEERYRLIMETAIDAIITTDEAGTILLVNPAAERIFGYSADEMIGQNVSMLMPEHRRAHMHSSMRHYLETGEKLGPWQDIEIIGLDKIGREIYLETSYSDYTLRGKHYFTGTFRDITERKELEAHKREFYRRTILAATEGKLVISEPEEIHEIAGDFVGSWRVERVEDIQFVREEIRRLAVENGMDGSRVIDFIGCAVEALANLEKHAGVGNVSLHVIADGLMLVVSDNGPGIEAIALPDVALTKGYTTAVSLGMGYKVMIEFADKVYLATSSKGTTVAIRMGLQAGPTRDNALLQKFPGWQEV